MNTDSIPRRLAAIAVADVAGYSRLMERDESETHARLQEILEKIAYPGITDHGGRLVKSTGDGFLAEFGSAVAAVRWAIELQQQMSTHDPDVQSDSRIRFRIGINIGDIIANGTDVAGDGVNVAARLESLAEPGGICLSGSVRDHVRDDLGVRFADLGEQQVKNIRRPIRVYRVDPDRGSLAPAGSSLVRRARAGWRRWAVAGVAVAIAAAGVWMLPVVKPWLQGQRVPPALSMAIVPFSATADDPAAQQLAEVLTHGLPTALGRWRWTRVVAHGVVAGYRSGASDARVAGGELGVRYLVEGEVRRTRDGLTVTAHLVDGGSGAQVWSDQLATADQAPRSAQGTLLSRLDVSLRRALHDAEMRRAAGSARIDDPMEIVLRGDSALHRGEGGKARAEARQLYDRALGASQDFVPALVGIVGLLDREIEQNPEVDRLAATGEMDRLSSRALAIDDTDAASWNARATALGWLGRWDEALAANAKARTLDPDNLEAMARHAWLSLMTGRPADAVAAANRALSFDPTDFVGAGRHACLGNLLWGRLRDAVSACARAGATEGSWIDSALLAAANIQTEDAAAAALARADVLRRQPGITLGQIRERFRSASPAFQELLERHVLRPLQAAGIPQ